MEAFIIGKPSFLSPVPALLAAGNPWHLCHCALLHDACVDYLAAGAGSPLHALPRDVLGALMDRALPRAPPRLVLRITRWMPSTPAGPVAGAAWPAQDVLAAAAFLL
jgi:hypothetical protein